MPIFYQQDIDDNTRLGIWRIEEDEAFFAAHVPLQRTITHPQKRLQHLAGRFLLKTLFNDFPVGLIQIADTRKPFLESDAFHFSISHCGAFAAAIVSRDKRAGLDIELCAPGTERIRHKFVSAEEEALWETPSGRTLEQQAFGMTTLLWSVKESVFKWYGLGGVDFRGHIHIRSVIPMKDIFLSEIRFTKGPALGLTAISRFLGDICLSYVVTETD